MLEQIRDAVGELKKMHFLQCADVTNPSTSIKLFGRSKTKNIDEETEGK